MPHSGWRVHEIQTQYGRALTRIFFNPNGIAKISLATDQPFALLTL
jgi:hypothetical protein